jgi:hypothetical protein
MNTREATKKEYDALNQGSEHGEQGLGFADFGLRIEKFWTEGQESGGTSGIVPIMTEPRSPLAGLDFYLVRQGIKTLFRCWRMEPVARRMHASLFLGLYGAKARASNEEPGGDTAGESAGAELKITFDDVQNTISPLISAVGQQQTSVTAPSQPKKTKSKKKVKSDMFDPFSGVFN